MKTKYFEKFIQWSEGVSLDISSNFFITFPELLHESWSDLDFPWLPFIDSRITMVFKEMIQSIVIPAVWSTWNSVNETSCNNSDGWGVLDQVFLYTQSFVYIVSAINLQESIIFIIFMLFQKGIPLWLDSLAVRLADSVEEYSISLLWISLFTGIWISNDSVNVTCLMGWSCSNIIFSHGDTKDCKDNSHQTCFHFCFKN